MLSLVTPRQVPGLYSSQRSLISRCAANGGYLGLGFAFVLPLARGGPLKLYPQIMILCNLLTSTAQHSTVQSQPHEPEPSGLRYPRQLTNQLTK